MKITRRQLRQIIKEGFTTVSDEEFDKITMPGYKGPQPGEYDYLDSIGSQEMADAKRAVGEDPAAQAAHLGIGIEDWYTIRHELDDHYEDRHMEDQIEWDEEHHPLDVNKDGKLSISEITRKQLRQIIDEVLEIQLVPNEPDDSLGVEDLINILQHEDDSQNIPRPVEKRRSGG